MDFLAAQHFPRVHFPGVQDLAAQRHDRLVDPVPGLLGGAAGGVPFHQEDLGLGRVVAGAVGQLAGQRRAADHFLAGHFLGGAQALLGVVDAQLGKPLGLVGVLVEPQGKGILDHPGHERRGLPGAEPLLGLAGEHGVLHFHAEHVAGPVPDVLRGQFDATRQQVAEFTEFAHRLQQAGAQAVDVGAALGGGDQVHVGLGDQLAAFRQPQHRPVHRFGVAAHGALERLRRHPLPAPGAVHQVFHQAVGVLPGFAFAGLLVFQGDVQPRAQHRLGAQQMAQPRHRDFRRVEIFLVRPEAHDGAGVALAHRVDHFQVADLLATAEFHVVQLAVALDQHLQLFRQGVDHRHADPVQAAGELVVLVGELTAGVQGGEDHFHARFLLHRVRVHRHAPAVVFHLDAAVRQQRHSDALGVAGQGLIHGVVHHFLDQVVGTAGIGVHARALAHRFQARQDLDVFGGIGVAHRCPKKRRGGLQLDSAKAQH